MNAPNWNWQDDERLNREYRSYQEKAEYDRPFMSADPNWHAECRPGDRSDERLQHAYREIQHRSECWRAAYHEAERSRRFAMWASVAAALMTVAALIGWLR